MRPRLNFIRRLFLCLAAIGGATAACGQTPTPAITSQQAVQKLNPDGESPKVTPIPVEPPSLIPPNNLPGAHALPAAPTGTDLQILNALFKQTSLGAIADERRLHLQLSELELRIRNDSDLHALMKSADAAPTDLIRRQRLMAYYRAYYDKLRKFTTVPDLIGYMNAQEAIHELSLLQPKTRHTTDEAIVAQLNLERGGASPPPLPKPVQARVNNVFSHP